MISIIHLDKEILRLNRFSKKKQKKREKEESRLSFQSHLLGPVKTSKQVLLSKVMCVFISIVT